jgi:hypothetical protein
LNFTTPLDPLYRFDGQWEQIIKRARTVRAVPKLAIDANRVVQLLDVGVHQHAIGVPADLDQSGNVPLYAASFAVRSTGWTARLARNAPTTHVLSQFRQIVLVLVLIVHGTNLRSTDKNLFGMRFSVQT